MASGERSYNYTTPSGVRLMSSGGATVALLTLEIDGRESAGTCSALDDSPTHSLYDNHVCSHSHHALATGCIVRILGFPDPATHVYMPVSFGLRAEVNRLAPASGNLTVWAVRCGWQQRLLPSHGTCACGLAAVGRLGPMARRLMGTLSADATLVSFVPLLELPAPRDVCSGQGQNVTLYPLSIFGAQAHYTAEGNWSRGFDAYCVLLDEGRIESIFISNEDSIVTFCGHRLTASCCARCLCIRLERAAGV